MNVKSRFLKVAAAVAVAVGVVWGAPISLETAQKVASNYLSRNGQSANLTLVKQKGVNSPFFIFSKGAGNGYLIVSADDIAAPIFCDADDGDFDEDNLNPVQAYLMQTYVNSINDAVKNKAAPDNETKALWEKYSTPSNQARGEVRAKTYLLATPLSPSPAGDIQWAQWQHGNQTPLIPAAANLVENGKSSTGKYSNVGCVATSMSQVIRYYGHPAQGKGTLYAYTPRKWAKGVYVPADNKNIDHTKITYNYSNMPGCLANATQAQQTEVGKLMANCGISVQMNYGANESSTYDWLVFDAMADNFDYDRCIQFVYKTPGLSSAKQYALSQTDWDDLIIGNIENKAPVIVAGGGHNFIIDGYDPTDKQFHINEGYAQNSCTGGTDYWYATSAIGGYGVNTMTINIMPNKNGNAPSVLKVTEFTASSSPVKVSAKVVFGQNFTGKIGIAQVSGDKITKILDSANFEVKNEKLYQMREGYPHTNRTSSVTLNKTGYSGNGSDLKVVTKRGSGEWSIAGAAQSQAPTPPTPTTVKITFDSRGGSSVPEESVAAGTAYTPAAVSTQSGYTFGGWYTNSGVTTKWVDGTIVNSDIKLYAKWTKETAALSGAKSFDGKHGIVVVKNPVVGDFAEFVVKTPESWTVAKLTIYDNLGNVVASNERRLTANDDKMKWNLRNANARAVAAGTYLAVVECQGANGVYRYYTKFGVRK